MLNILFKTSSYLLLTIVLSSCASTSFSDLFSNYNQQMSAVKKAQQQGDFQQALSVIPERSEGNGSFTLSILEKARLEYLLGNYSGSQQDFEFVYRRVQEADQAAKVQLSRGVEKATSVLSNDNAIRYEIPYYEQSMLNSYQALNYLNQQDFTGALVEIRRANLVQNNALKANQKELAESYSEMAKQGVTSESLSSKYPSMNNAIGKVKNGFQNAYTFYLSGVLYEANGEPNSAYIDFKKALEIYPHNITLQKDVWRLANALGMDNDIPMLKKRFSSDIIQINHRSNKEKKGKLVIIVENGIIPNKEEVSIHLPIWSSSSRNYKFYNLALPRYQNKVRQYRGLSMNYQGKQYQSEEIVRLQSLAAKQLQDQMPGIVARQVVRLIAKEEIRQQMSRKGGDLGNIFANLYNIASEKADTRSWSTLPDSIHILSTSFEPGEHEVKLTVNGNLRTINFRVNEDRQTLIKLTAIGSYTNYQSFNL